MESDSTQIQSRRMSTTSSTDYSKYGIRDEPKHTTTTALGKTKTFARLRVREWLFFAVSLINIVTAIVLTVYRLVVVIQDDSKSSDFTFIIILLINTAFCIFYVIHGVLRERVYELYALMVAIVVVALYCILEYFTFNKSGETTIKLIRVIAVLVLAPFNIILAYLVSRGFGYLEFRIVGASEYLQRLYREAAIFSCLLKFDVQATCSVVVLALKDGTDVSTAETVSLAVGIPFSIFWSIFGWIMLRKELKNFAILFAVLGLIKPSYYFYKIIKEYINIHDDSVSTDNTIVYSLIGAVTVGLLVWLMLMMELVFVYRNFGKGLRERVRSFHAQTQVVTDESSGLLAHANQERWPRL